MCICCFRVFIFLFNVTYSLFLMNILIDSCISSIRLCSSTGTYLTGVYFKVMVLRKLERVRSEEETAMLIFIPKLILIKQLISN